MITKIGKVKLEERIAQLKEELRLTYQQRAEAAAEGDLKENSAYIFAGEHAHVLNSQIEEAVSELKESTLITPPIQFDIIAPGHQVTVIFESDQRQLSIVLVGKNDARLKPNWVSVESPLGNALLNKSKNQKVTVNDQLVKIIDITLGDI